MSQKLYVGNLAYSSTEEGLHQLFSEAGKVVSVRIITDRDTGRSKGFAFVEMSSPAEAQAAIQKLNQSNLDGRSLNVSEARPQEPRSGGGGGDRGGYGGGGGGRGGHRGY